MNECDLRKGNTKKSWLKFEGEKAMAAYPGCSPCTEHCISD